MNTPNQLIQRTFSLNFLISILFGALIVSTFSILTIWCFSPDIWFDEACSLNFIRCDWSNLITYTLKYDVHPPLYYALLKLFIGIGCYLTSPGLNIFFAKLLSLAAVFCSALLVVVKIWKQHHSMTAAMLCALGVCTAPSCLAYALEIRMYAWGCFFVTACYLWMWDVMTRNRVRDWAIFCLFSLLAAYTHHFASIAIACINLVVFIHVLLRRREFLKRWICYFVVFILCYSPWLVLVILNQAKSVQESWWVQPVTSKEIISSMWFSCHNKLIIVVVFVGITVMLFQRLVVQKRNRLKISYLLLGLSLPFVLIATSLVISYLFQPALVNRYIFPGLGASWIAMVLGVYTMLGESETGKMRCRVWQIICILLSVPIVQGLLRFSKQEYNAKTAVGEILSQTNNDAHAVILFTEIFDANPYMIISGKECYLWNPSRESVHCSIFEAASGMLSSVEELRELQDKGRTLYAAVNETDKKHSCLFFSNSSLELRPCFSSKAGNKHPIKWNNLSLFRIKLKE